MRLDHFLPFLARPRSQSSPVRSLPYRWLRRCLPSSWTSTTRPRRIGKIRQTLRRMGLSWQASPLRRLVQSICFGLFLYLFFYVCWPYRAIPAQEYNNWIPAEVDTSQGQIQLITEGLIPEALQPDDKFYVSDQGQSGDSAYLGEFTILSRASDHLLIGPSGVLNSDEWESLSFSLGPWVLSPHPPDHWPSHYADTFTREDRLPAEIFLILDPLVSVSTAIADRNWVWSLTAAAIILVACILIPRGFCGYLCPLGTLIDLFDWALGKRVRRFRVSNNGWWVHLKYYLLIAVLAAAVGGVLLSGFVAAIPVITRGLLYALAPVQDGFIRGWHQVPALNSGHYLSLALFLLVLGLGFLQPRFWCKYVCPSGAMFSLGNLFRVSERKVESSCIHCNQCVEVCPFDAIKPDFTTRTTDCTLCQTCGGVCPSHSIKFVERWNFTDLKAVNVPPTGEFNWGRRSFLASGLGGIAGIIGGAAAAWGVRSSHQSTVPTALPVRPPGSVPETDFLELCIRCGECFKVCPNNVLQAEGFKQGWEGLWTPEVVADWAGCEPSCNACGQVCPTGAIRALPLEEKRHARMGLALVNSETCLPFAGREACQLCVDECTAAGYNALEFIAVHTRRDDTGQPIAGSGFLAPKVRAEACVGCGLCQTRCYSVNAKDKGLLEESAIIIAAGEGREDRLRTGSYAQRAALRVPATPPATETAPITPSNYLPEFLNSPTED